MHSVKTSAISLKLKWTFTWLQTHYCALHLCDAISSALIWFDNSFKPMGYCITYKIYKIISYFSDFFNKNTPQKKYFSIAQKRKTFSWRNLRHSVCRNLRSPFHLRKTVLPLVRQSQSVSGPVSEPVACAGCYHEAKSQCHRRQYRINDSAVLSSTVDWYWWCKLEVVIKIST